MRDGFNGYLSRGEEDLSADGEATLRRCDAPGCDEFGEHRAPKSRERLRDYYWFCLEHVREYNRAWNFYAGMSDAEVEHERRADTYWHRPTWRISGNQAFGGTVRDDFGLFGEQDSAAQQDREERFSATAPELAALAVLNLSPPVTRQMIKSRYKELVKRHHPDANGGSKEAEERLKAINRAYETLTRGADL